MPVEQFSHPIDQSLLRFVRTLYVKMMNTEGTIVPSFLIFTNWRVLPSLQVNRLIFALDEPRVR